MFSVLRRDSFTLFLGGIPIALGLLFYFLIGRWVYTVLLPRGQKGLESLIGIGSWADFLSYILLPLVTVVMFFFINWTFVLVVSLVASPFNDLISSRVERIVSGGNPESPRESFRKMLRRVRLIFVNEIKKIIFVVSLTILAFGLSLFPLLVPVSVLLSALLMSMSFLDYSWCRHQMPLGECLSHLRSSFGAYAVSGGIFMVLMSIPLVNLFSLPLAIIYFTILFTKRSEN